MLPVRWQTAAVGFPLAVGLLGAGRCVHASDVERADGVYGRLDGDTVFSLEAGGGVVGGTTVAPGLAGTLRARHLDMAGAFLGYERASAPTRFDALSFGVDLRPLVFARIFSDWEHGPATLDLLVDSIGLEMGAAWLRPGDPWGSGSGLAWVLGTGVDVPCAWSRGTGLAVRVAVRWYHAEGWDAQSPRAGVVADDTVTLSVLLVGRTVARVGTVPSGSR